MWNSKHLPESADIKILQGRITVREHMVVKNWYGEGLFGTIMSIARDPDSHREILSKFEDYGISYMAVIDYCTLEIRDDVDTLSNLIFVNHARTHKIKEADAENNWKRINYFSASKKGRAIAGQIVEKIKSCDNWGELYAEMHPASEFQKETRRKIKEEMEIQWHKV